MQKTYWIITYGCQMNESDSERISAVLESMEYEKSKKPEEADLLIFNACSIRQSAIDRIYGQINNFKKIKNRNSKPKIILTGCILNSDIKKLKEKVDYIFSIKSLKNWQEYLKKENYFYYPSHIKEFQDTSIDEEYLKIQPISSSFSTAFIPISIGCNNFCSYCVVPYVKGPEICRKPQEIISETKRAIKKGSKEIWLLGQNVNSYKSRNINFPKLLKMTNDIKGDFWIRFTSSNPKDFSDELIKIMIRCEKVTPYLHLPLQSGDNTILKKMKRNYTVEKYKNIVKKVRDKMPFIALSTDIIIGFPGETKQQFENTKKVFEEIKFDMAYISKYSSRPSTMASKMKDNVSKIEKKRREEILTKILKKSFLKNNKKYIGKIVRVLPHKWEKGILSGKSFDYKTIKFKGDKNKIGIFQKVKIKNVLIWSLKGEIIKKRVTINKKSDPL